MTYYILGTDLIGGNEDETWDKICRLGLKIDPGTRNRAFKINVEKDNFRNATVDTLIGLTEAIQKLDLNLESVIKKVEKQHKELDPTWDIKISTNEGEIDVRKYMEEFNWEDSKFPRSKTLPELIRLLQDKTTHLDNDMKKQIADYAETKAASTAIIKKQEGGLITKDLTESFIDKGLTQESFPSTRLLITLVAIIGK